MTTSNNLAERIKQFNIASGWDLVVTRNEADIIIEELLAMVKMQRVALEEGVLYTYLSEADQDESNFRELATEALTATAALETLCK